MLDDDGIVTARMKMIVFLMGLMMAIKMMILIFLMRRLKVVNDVNED
jgi:hypothetical protein